MIVRQWHGWTAPAHVDAGYRGIELLRRPSDDTVEPRGRSEGRSS
jgi:hypothetical protein